MAGSVFSRSQSKVASTSLTQSSYSKAKDRPFMGASMMTSVPLVIKNKLQIAGGVCVTLVKGSLVQQKVNVTLSCFIYRMHNYNCSNLI